MNNFSVYKSKTCLWTVKQLTSVEINLNPKYQRNLVWNSKQKNKCIVGVYRNAINNTIILNDNKRLICIDGKQRISTLIEFVNNKMPVSYEKNGIAYIQYFGPRKDLPYEYKNYNIFSDKERKDFLNKTLIVKKYEGLTYKDEKIIFIGAQDGTKLSEGELCASKFTDDEIHNAFDELCNMYAAPLKPFFDTNRKDHNPFFVRLAYYFKNGLRYTNKNITDKFIGSSNNETSFIKNIRIIDELANASLTKRLLNNTKVINKKIKIITLEVFLYCLNQRNILSDLDYSNNCDMLITIIDKLDLYFCTLKGGRNNINLNKMKDRFNDLYNMYYKK